MRAHDWDARYEANALLWGSGPNRFVRSELAEHPAGRALDLACGEGRNAIWLTELGWVVEGVDFSAVAIERAVTLAGERGLAVTFRVGDVLDVDRTGEFDLVLIAYVQLPPDERSRLLRVARAALAPGGILLLVGHDLRNHADGVGGPKDRALSWTVEEVVAALEALEIERADVVARPVEGEARPALDTLVRARRRP